MRTHEMTELMNICMIYDDNGNVLVQNRKDKGWPGVTFPGGHVEKAEALVPSVIREIKEETGLDISDVKLCGIKEWFNGDVRAFVFFYKTNHFSGELKSSEEGEVFWVPMNKLSEYPLASDFDKNLQMFFSDDISELFYQPGDKQLMMY